MGEELKIIITGDASGAIGALTQTKTALNQLVYVSGGKEIVKDIIPPTLPRAAKEASGSIIEFGERVDKMGRESRLAMRAIGDVSMFAGFGSGATAMAMQAANAADAIGDLSGGLAAINPVMLGLAGLGTVVGVAFQKVQDEAKRVADEIAKIKKPFEELRGEIEALVALKGFDKIAAEIGVSADALKNYASSGQGANDRAVALTQAQQDLALRTRELNEATTYLKELQDALGSDVEYSGQLALQEIKVRGLQEATGHAANAVERLKSSITSSISATDAWGKTIDPINERWRQYEGRVKGVAGTGSTMKEWEQEREQGAKKYADALKQLNESMQSMVRGAVEKALSPTDVTDKDKQRIGLLKDQAKIQKELADADLGAGKRRQLQSKAGEIDDALKGLGPYKDKWDEFRRRVEDIDINKMNPAKYGDAFAKMLKDIQGRTKMSLGEISESFKDYSLFADSRNLVAIQWGPLDAQIQQNINALIGRANVIKHGVDAAWKNMTKDQKAALKDIGIDSSADMKKTLAGAADSGVGGFVGQIGDKETKKKLAAAGDTLVKTVSAGVTDKATIKVWTDTMDALIVNGMAFFSTKESVAKLQDGGKAIIESISIGVAKNQTALSDALIGAVMLAIADATAAAMPDGGGAVRAAATGVGATPAGSGASRVQGAGANGNVVINYNPSVSLATASEANAALASAARAAARDAARRGGQ